MSDGVQEAVLLLISSHFAHQENRIENHAGNDDRKEDNPEKQRHDFTPVEDDPANVEYRRDARR